MAVPEVPRMETNQKTAAFWTNVHIAKNTNINETVKNYDRISEWRALLEDPSKGSLKGRWYT